MLQDFPKDDALKKKQKKQRKKERRKMTNSPDFQMVSADWPTDLKRKLAISAFSHCSQVEVCVSSLEVCVEEGKLMSLKAGFTQSCKGQGDRTAVCPVA